jgi:hypothetical protein
VADDPFRLDRIQQTIDEFKTETLTELKGIKAHLREQNSKIATQGQALFGPFGKTGLVKDVEDLEAKVGSRPTPGTITTRTMWTAVAAITGIVAVLITVIARVG